MKIASLLAGSLALGGGIVKFFDISSGAQDSSVAAFLLSLIGLLMIGAGYWSREDEKSAH